MIAPKGSLIGAVANQVYDLAGAFVEHHATLGFHFDAIDDVQITWH